MNQILCWINLYEECKFYLKSCDPDNMLDKNNGTSIMFRISKSSARLSFKRKNRKGVKVCGVTSFSFIWMEVVRIVGEVLFSVHIYKK